MSKFVRLLDGIVKMKILKFYSHRPYVAEYIVTSVIIFLSVQSPHEYVLATI